MTDIIGGSAIHPSSVITRKLYREDIQRRRRESPGKVAWTRDGKGWRHWCCPPFYGYSTSAPEHPEHCPTCAERGLMHLLCVLRLLTQVDGQCSSTGSETGCD